MAITKVTTDVITALAVTAPKLAANAVTTDKLADNAVTAAKIAAGALGDQVAGITSSASATTIAGTLTSTGAITGTLATAAQTNITSLGTLTTLTVDDITINGSTISDAGDFTLDVGGDISLSADDNGEIHLYDGSLHYGSLLEENSNLIIQSIVQDEDILFKGNDGSSVITALTLDMSKAGSATFNHDIILGDNGQALFGAGDDLTIYHDGSDSYIKDTGSGNLLIQYSDLYFSKDAGSSHSVVFRSTGRVGIGTTGPDFPLHVSSTGTVLGLNATSGAVSQRFNENGTARFFLLTLDGSNGLAFVNGDGTSERMRITATGKVGIGNTAPASLLDVGSTSSNGTQITITTNTSSYGGLYFADGADEAYRGAVQYKHGDDFMHFYTAGAERMRILAGGGLTFNGDTAAANALDDYEEGTWTPALDNVTTNSSTMYGIYTKIGRIVHIHAKIDVTVASLPGAQFQISGLPYAATNTSDTGQRAIIAVGGDAVNLGGNAPKMQFITNASTLQAVAWNASNNTAAHTYNAGDGNDIQLHVHGFYTT